ncbi:MAG TPA: chemotaxis protein CheX [Myxococcales bacterium]|nr:chemotaxis protein CheX [Myxococcales bacterium]
MNSTQCCRALERLPYGVGAHHRFRGTCVGLLPVFQAQVPAMTRYVWAVLLNIDLGLLTTQEVSLHPKVKVFESSVNIEGGWSGRVSIRCPEFLVRRWAASMLSIAEDKVVHEDINDALGELANILAGNLKRVLPGNPRLGLPETSSQMTGVKQRTEQACTQFTFEDAGVPFIVAIYEDDTEL